MKTVPSREIIVGSVTTEYDIAGNREPAQKVQFMVLGRKSSLDFRRRFGSESRDSGAIVAYASRHALEWLCLPLSSFSCSGMQLIKGEKCHTGNVLTEKEAFDIGYPEPYLDTLAWKIANAHLEARRMGGGLTTLLRKQGVINNEQSACYFPLARQIHVFSNERMQEYLDHGRDPQGIKNDSTHPITLDIWKSTTGIMPIGASMYVEQVNKTYEFMTYMPSNFLGEVLASVVYKRR